MAETKVFDIDRLRNRLAGRIKVDGVEHDVLQVKGGTYQSLRAAAPGEAMERVYRAVAEVCPSLTAEQVSALNLDQANAIIGIAGLGVEAVEKLYPNEESPAAAAVSTSPG